DAEQTAVPAGGPAVRVDGHLAASLLRVHGARQLAHESIQTGLDVGVGRARSLALEVDVDPVEVPIGDRAEDVADGELVDRRHGDDVIDRGGAARGYGEL